MRKPLPEHRTTSTRAWRILAALAALAVISPAAQAAVSDPACAALANSVERAPDWYADRCLGGARGTEYSVVDPNTLGGTLAYYKNNFPAPLNLKTAPLPTLTYSIVGPQTRPLFAMSFNLDLSVLYAVDFVAANANKELGTVNPATGAFTLIAVIPGQAAFTPTALSFDPTTGIAYFSSTNGTTATLYTINLATAAVTPVGPITGFPFTIDMAFDSNGNLFGHEIALDQLISINKATGAGTLIGPTGLSANFAQGMMYDHSAGVLYGCAFVVAPVQQGHLVSFNTSTGAATILATTTDELECSVFAPAVQAAIELTKTVGTVPAVCAVTDSVTVATGTTVYYCYSVENTGGVTFEFHDLEDDVLGTLLSNEPITLAPGDTIEFIEPDTANATVTNTGTWTAKEVLPGYAFDNTVAQGFTDISATGTALNLTDDSTAPVTMPFAFELYGASSTQLCVSNNGNMAHGSATCSGAFTNEPLPSATLGGAAIVPYWDDLDEESGNVYHQSMGVAPNRAFIVQWHQRPHFPGPNANTVTFQAVLRETSNTINFYYLDTTFGDPATNNGASATVGLQQSTTFANQFSFDTVASIPDNEAILAAIVSGEEATDSDTASVTIADPDIDVTPTSLSSTLGPDEQETQPLDIDNLGTGDLDWSLEEAPPAPRVSLPRSDGNFVHGKLPPSAGRAPNSRPQSTPAVGPQPFAFGTTPAYSWNSQSGPYYTVFDLGVPEELPNVAPFPGNGQFIGAGEFVDGLVYMVDIANTMWEVDPATGAILDTFTATAPPGGETYSGMAIDPTSGTVYAGSTNVATSTLLTMDVTTGAASVVGPITNCPGLIALAVDGNGDLWGYDIVGDVLLSIDKTTGAGTVVGPIGFDANFGQGMGYDPNTDTVYMAAFNNATFQAELRSVDTTTGNTTLVGVLGSTIPGGLNQLSWLGLEIGLGPCSAPSDLPWVSADPTSGTTPPNGTSTVDVTFDSTGLSAGTYDGFLCINSNDPDEDLVEVPVQLIVDSMPFLDGFETGDTSRWSFVLP